VERLNKLGFDIEELMIKTEENGRSVKIQPKVVDAGHHTRRLIRLTGLDVQENQARRLLNDLDAFRVKFGTVDDEEVLAHRWLSEVFEPVVKAIPKEYSGKLEPAEIFHQVLEHRGHLAENQQQGVPLLEAFQSYVENVLAHRRDEEALLSTPTEAITLPTAIPSGTIEAEEDEAGDWRDKV
jgi:hypothetical protein